MSKKYDVVATIGSYEKNGEKKYLTRNVGSIIQTQKGFRLALDASFNPAGCRVEEDGKVWLALFPPKPRDGQGYNDGTAGPARDYSRPEAAEDDSIPF